MGGTDQRDKVGSVLTYLRRSRDRPDRCQGSTRLVSGVRTLCFPELLGLNTNTRT